MIDKLRSPHRSIVLHAIGAIERIAVSQQAIASDSVVEEIRSAVTSPDDEVSAKAMCVVARLEKLDKATIDSASIMLESNHKHVIFAGAYALATLDSVPEHAMQAFDRGYLRALQACDYEFLGLFAAAYSRWLDDPESHLENLLQHSPEHLSIALETLQQVPRQLVSIGTSSQDNPPASRRVS